MSQSDSNESRAPKAEWLIGGGEMGKLIRSMDWSKTALGPLHSWPQSLRTTVSLCLASNFPICIAWGPGRVQIYNDGYWPICGGKHPQSMGMDFRECWFSAWPSIGEAFESATAGQTRFLVNQRMFLDRHGYLEETFFTFSFSPIRDETGNLVGLFHPVTEMTQQTLAERRLKVLRDIADRTSEAQTIKEACRLLAETLSEHQLDLPFVLLYLLKDGGAEARLQGCTGLLPAQPASPEKVAVSDSPEAAWPMEKVVRSARMERVDDLEGLFGPLECGPYPESPKTAFIQPIQLPGKDVPLGLLIAGTSPRRVLDDSYETFYAMLGESVTNALLQARAFEEERKRAEALAEIDRAKTAFFSNVSHEFRTPLTLMLGPLEDLLAPDREVEPGVRDLLTVAHRNSLRLLKLVNTLLDFSRIEAGRVEASYEATDLAGLTGDLASNFRSACERAGVQLIVDCPRLPEPVYVDRDMWEKIVLNLLSNAFKFTFEGEISVNLESAKGLAQLTVTDSGTGIPEQEIDHIFERFHRVKDSRGRTHEGTGIGLALVLELTKLHGGTVRADSTVGRGSTFTVSIPLGKGHLPSDRIAASRSLSSTALGAGPYVEEAMRWLPAPSEQATVQESGKLLEEAAPVPSTSRPPRESPRHRIVWADDNSDMREYVRRLLSRDYEVEAVPDGLAALQSCRRRPPALVLADVMMPRLDGFGLLRELRTHEPTRTVPVILLSARAGEESRLEGLEAGADDYLIKPFSARELLARVGAHVELARLRRETEQVLKEVDRRKDEFLATLSHELRGPLAPLRNALEVMKLSGDDEALRERARITMERQLSQLMRLVNDLLDISRITRDRLELQKETVDLAAVLQQAVESCRPLIEEQGQALALQLPPEKLLLKADPLRLVQVFSNLLDNARKYTPPGGQIQLRAQFLGGRDLEVSVHDTGVGIPADRLEGIFEMFSQVEPNLERSKGGLGIGLTLVRRLVELHGGQVEARSDGPDQGSEFVVRLPVVVPEEPAEKKEPPLHQAAGGRRVLVVDDHRDSAESLAMLLRLLGDEPHMAHDGQAAVEAARNLQPDIILLDIGLPRLNGYEACRLIRAQPGGDRLFIVALTGWGQEEDRRKSEEAGFDAHLVKPVDPDVLTDLIGELTAGGGSRPTAARNTDTSL